jgi:hypothetical protein
MEEDDNKKEAAKMIGFTATDQKEGGGSDDDVAMNEGGTGIDSSIPKELKKRKSKEPETSSDSETSPRKLKRTSKACNRNTVSIVATSGSVSKIVLRTPNVPSPRKVHTF